MVSNMVKAVRLGNEELHLAMLWLLAYTFPSYCVCRRRCCDALAV